MPDLAATTARIETLITAMDAHPAEARRHASELVRETMALYGIALERVLDIAREQKAQPMIERLTEDEAVATVLALHDLVPRVEPSTPLVQIRRGQRREHSETVTCERCEKVVSGPPPHRHIVDIGERRLLCSCVDCWESVREDHGGSTFRAVPRTSDPRPPLRINEAHWDALEIPVGLAFFIVHSGTNRTFAFYPSPAGSVESLLPLDAWRDLASENPWLASIGPDVEALVVRRALNLPEEWHAVVVPVDACYDLIGRIRVNWRGFDGGDAVRREVDDFFVRHAAVRAPQSPASA